MLDILIACLHRSFRPPYSFNGPVRMLPPLLFQPLMKRIRWGGRRLGSLLQKPIGNENDYAESWEIADHADGQSIVASGEFQGRSLNDLMQEYRRELLGCQSHLSQFPLLIKFLDANDWLSLQVHPDDLLAREFQGRCRSSPRC